MIIVYTGNGKGKTTAALGQAMRALGEGPEGVASRPYGASKKVIMIQFIKGSWISGEDHFLRKFKIPKSKFRIIKCGKGFVGIMGDKLPRSVHKKAAKDTLKLAEKTILSKKYDLVILDEVNVAVGLKLIYEKDVLKMLKRIPQGVDVVLTGRNAPQKLVDLADIATEMKEIKYKFRPVKQGVEY